jgi:predicted PhzF superfamily epimerase YddE/YHI9
LVEFLQVFGGESGGGNALAVALDGQPSDPQERQRVAHELGLSETVFVDDAAEGRVRIFTPAAELPFAGHPLVGTGWLLGVAVLRPPAGEVPARQDGDLSFVAGRPEWAPEFSWYELGSADEVEALEPPSSGLDAYWAWIEPGVVRARVFPCDLGIVEDEATGAAAVVLASSLGRSLEIRQGTSSVIYAAPLEGGLVEVGGRVRRATNVNMGVSSSPPG